MLINIEGGWGGLNAQWVSGKRPILSTSPLGNLPPTDIADEPGITHKG